MKARALFGDRWLVRLDLGEELVATITRFLEEKRIRCASLQGIGAVRDLEVGFLDTSKRSYERRRFPEEMELLSLSGNASLKEGHSFLHAHVVASGRECRTVGGHLFAATVSATAEVFVHSAPGVDVSRRERPELGFFDLDV